MSNEYPTIISYYTKDWLYEKYAMEMRDSCDRLGLEHNIEELESKNSYLANCRMKPRYIYNTISSLKKPVLWIDADGGILKKPDYFLNLTEDFAAKKMAPKKIRDWHVGTMWFNYTENCLNFIERWIEYTNKSISDEEGLYKYLKENPESITIKDIPENYFFINKKNQVPGNTVIFHRISTSDEKMRMKRANRK